MSEIELLKRIIKQKIDFNIYYVLFIIQSNAIYEFGSSLMVKMDELVFSGYLTPVTFNLTPKAVMVLEAIQNSPKSSLEPVYEALRQKLKEYTGKTQKVLNGRYSFLPNFRDFSEKLSKAIVKYELKNLERVEKCLLLHITNSHKANWDKVQLLGYFISKDGNSSLATCYFSEDSKEEIGFKSNQKFM